MKNLIFLSLAFSSIAFADATMPRTKSTSVITDGSSVDSYCGSFNSNLLQRYTLSGRPGYFVKPVYIEGKLKFSLLLNGRPALFDPETGNAKYLPGAVDPVASFDDKIMTVLEGPPEKRKVDFLQPSTLQSEKPKRIQSSVDIYGAYQAMAPVTLENGKAGYRLLIDEFDRDTKVDKSYPAIKDLILENGTLKETSSGFTYPCKGKNLQTPYLEKHGKKLVALNTDTQTTQVFDLENGKCDFITEVPYRTGKADFSFDGSKIAFHVEEVPAADRRGWVGRMNDHDVSNIYVFDLKTGKTEKITNNQKANSYYPTFLPDGTVAHIDMIQTDDVSRPKYAIGISRTSLSGDKKETVSVCDPQSGNKKAFFAIGQILSGICNDSSVLPKIGEEAIVLKTTGLTGKECRDLISRFWTPGNIDKLSQNTEWSKMKSITQNQFTSLKTGDLLAACPDDVGTNEPTAAGKIDSRLVPHSCSSCHGQALPLDSINGLNARKPTGTASRGTTLKEEVIRRLKLPASDPQHMPPSGFPQSSADRAVIEQYLKHIEGL